MDEIIEAVKLMAADRSQKAVGKALGFSPAYINGLLNGRYRVTGRLAKAMGYKKVVTWEKDSH